MKRFVQRPRGNTCETAVTAISWFALNNQREHLINVSFLTWISGCTSTKLAGRFV